MAAIEAAAADEATPNEASAPAARLNAAPPAARLNGFDVAGALVPREAIRPGGPKRDGIRSVDAPAFVPAAEAKWVLADTPVVGIVVDDDARAYPVHLLEYHQVVNDTVGGRPVVVTYDPLTASPLAFSARIGGEHRHFGVSGLVYESHFLAYDRESESLWSPLRGEAIAGPLAGTRLERLVVRQEAFAVWLHRHPQTTVLERPSPERIDYRHSPFTAYWVSETIPFPVSSRDDGYHPKELALGVEAGGVVRAFLGSILRAAGGRVVDEVGGAKVRIAYDADVGAFSWEAPDGVRVTDAYWFAWKAFHPDTEVWQPEGSEPASAPVGEPKR